MARCSSCNLLCSIEQGDPEAEDVNISVEQDNKSGTVNGTVRLPLLSACCNDEIKEASPEFEAPVDLIHDHPKNQPRDFTAEIESANATDRYEGKGRGARHYYGAELEITVTCACGWTTQAGEKNDKGEIIPPVVEEQASCFDDL